MLDVHKGKNMHETEDSNRREHKRILVSNPMTVESDGDSYSGRILNISAGGAGISMELMQSPI